MQIAFNRNKKKIKPNSKIIQIKTNVEDNLTIKQYYLNYLTLAHIFSFIVTLKILIGINVMNHQP